MKKRVLLLFIVSLFLYFCSQGPTELERPEITFSFSLREPSHVTLIIYDQFDMLEKILVNEELSANNYNIVWDCRNEEGHQIASGYYFYIIRVNGLIIERTMVLLK